MRTSSKILKGYYTAAMCANGAEDARYELNRLYQAATVEETKLPAVQRRINAYLAIIEKHGAVAPVMPTFNEPDLVVVSTVNKSEEQVVAPAVDNAMTDESVMAPDKSTVAAVNSLVYIRDQRGKGICCVAKISGQKATVNVGKHGAEKVALAKLELIDTSNCKTVSFHEYRSRVLDDKGTLNDCIVGNEVMHFVGIGWNSHGVATEEHLKTLPRVIQA